jgi:four helix bundle protein
VPSNIAEGEGRGSPREFAQFLRIAHGSLRELETQVLIAQRLSYVTGKEAASLLDVAAEVGRLITGLIRSMKL